MEHVQFSGRWGDYFHRQGLRTLDDFFQLPRRGIVGRNARRDVQKFLLREEGDPDAFFIKRFWRPQAKDILSPVRRFGRLIPQARIEWENALPSPNDAKPAESSQEDTGVRQAVLEYAGRVLR